MDLDPGLRWGRCVFSRVVGGQGSQCLSGWWVADLDQSHDVCDFRFLPGWSRLDRTLLASIADPRGCGHVGENFLAAKMNVQYVMYDHTV